MDYAEQEALISEVETKIERLRALYDQYFMGFEKIEPLVPRKDVDRKLYVLRREQIRNTALRFRFNQVVSRYNTFATHWQRLLREIENGTYKRDVARAAKRFGADALTIQAKRRLKHKGGEPEAEAPREPEAVQEREPQPSREPERHVATTREREPTVEAPPASSNEVSVDLGTLLPAASVAPAGRAPRVSKASSFQKLDLDTDDLEEMTPPRGTPKPAVVTRPAAPAAASPGARPVPGPVVAAPGARPVPGAPAVPPARPSPSVAPAVPAARPSPAVPAARPLPAAPPLPAAARPAAPGAPPLPGARPSPVASNVPAARPSPGPVPNAPLVAANSGRLPVAPSPAGGPVRVVVPPGAAAPPPARPPLPSAPVARSSEPTPVARPAATPAPAPRPAAATAPIAAPAPRPAAAAPTPAPPVRPAPAPAARPAPAPAPAPVVARPAARDEGGLSETRLRELYGKLVETKRANNESTAGVSVDGLTRSLRESQQKLREKHAGKNIDFDVVVKDGKAVVRPIIK